MSKPIIVIIAGPAASGKTSLITWLYNRYPHLISIICVDNYYFNQDHMPIHERFLQNYDHPDSLEWPLLEKHLRILKNKEAVEGPRYCFVQQTRIKPPISLTPKPVILLDGLLTLSVPSIRELADVSLYIDTPIDICLARKIKRDIDERGRTLEQSLNQYLTMTRPMYYEYILPSRQHADFIIPSSNNMEKACLLIENYLKHQLEA